MDRYFFPKLLLEVYILYTPSKIEHSDYMPPIEEEREERAKHTRPSAGQVKKILFEKREKTEER